MNPEQIGPVVNRPEDVAVKDPFEAPMGEIFDNAADPEGRFNEFSKKLQGFINIASEEGLSLEEINKAKDNFKSCCSLQNKEDFIQQGIAAIKPLLDWKTENKELFEAKMRKIFVENSGFIPLNESISYGKHKDSVHIHVAPSKTLDMLAKYALLKGGLRKLQDVLKNDEEIKEVTATSWIIATEAGKRIMEKLGFTVIGEISKEMREKHFPDENRSVFEAFISREDFLNPDKYK
jgi:transcriptional/translational regulatory protein YebC/TACO1